MTARRVFLHAGHLPTLVAALLYFDVSFMVWVLLGPLAPFLGDALHLTATEQGLLTAVPLLGGSLFRPLLGVAGDRIGGRRTALIGLGLTLVVLVAAWRVTHTLAGFYAVGVCLGIAGASFAVALPLAARWYPPEYQGLAMGIAGAGNSGTLLATLLAPRIAERFGWESAFACAAVPVALVLVVVAVAAKDSPRRGRPASLAAYTAVCRERDTFWLAGLYSLTFGGFVGFASFLTTFFHEQYHLSRVAAGDFTTTVVVAGSLLRPVGGWLADRIGGYRLLVGLLAVFSIVCAALTAASSAAAALVLLFIAMGILGMGNGAVFQIVPQRFPDSMGIVTGLVGAAGGLGGFFLPTLLGAIKDATGEYTIGLWIIAGAFLAGAVVLLELGARWARQWPAAAARRSGVFAYRSRTVHVPGGDAA
jgi:NNP family nitrate/nitrite transporter-like MFS transporter